MPQESGQAELNDVSDLSVREDENLVRRPLDRVIAQQVLQQFQSNLRFELLFEHFVEDEVQNGEHRRHFLVAVLVLLAEHVVHVVEVQLEKLNLAGRFVGRHVDDGLEVEDFRKHSALAGICACLLQALRLVLVQLSVQEERLLGVGGR